MLNSNIFSSLFLEIVSINIDFFFAYELLKNPVNKNMNETSINMFLFNLSVIFV